MSEKPSREDLKRQVRNNLRERSREDSNFRRAVESYFRSNPDKAFDLDSPYEHPPRNDNDDNQDT